MLLYLKLLFFDIMFRYLRSRIGSSYELKNENLDDFVSYTQLDTHGYPQKVSCFDIDDTIGRLAIGTRDGNLQIFGPNGLHLCGAIQNMLPIVSIHFIIGTDMLILRYENLYRKGTQQFYKCQIVGNHLHFTNLNYEIHLKKITCCEVLPKNADGNSALLIGTIIGNVYALWVRNMELVEYVVFLDTSMTQLTELDSQHKAIDGMFVHPNDFNRLFLLFNNSIVVLYDTIHDRVVGKFNIENKITHISLGNNAMVYCSHKDGTYTALDIPEAAPIRNVNKRPFGQMQCSKMIKVISALAKNRNEEFVIFSGGMPEDIEDRNTISLFCNDKSLILDFDSCILDFKIYKANGVALALFVFCEEEFVAIDLNDPLWRMFPLPYLCAIHASPITCVTAVSELTDHASKILAQIASGQRNSSDVYSRNPWPLDNNTLTGNYKKETNAKDLCLIVTGHENGTINIWLATDLNFRLWISYNTARDFEGYREANDFVTHIGNDENDVCHQYPDGLPPIRKAGIFDPFSDDPRLCIHKLFFDRENANFAVGGQAGQLMVYEGLFKNETMAPNRLLVLDMVETSPDISFKNSAQQSAIQPRRGQAHYSLGFQLFNNIVAQFKPPVPVSSLCWCPSTKVLAAGNEFGYAVCSLSRCEVLLVKTLISSLDVVQISNRDGAISRFKSVKKSIRQSFRRKKRTNLPDQQDIDRKDMSTFHSTEREVVQRKLNPNIHDGETPNSLVKVISFKTCSLSPSNQQPGRYLFVGTHGGSALIHAINCANSCLIEPCPLIKEIKLQHRAPIVAIECLQQTTNSHLLIFSEEQIRSFLLPTLKSSNLKYRLTATEGSRIRKVSLLQLSSKVRRMRSPEKFIAMITNRAEIFLLPMTTFSRKPYIFQFTKPADSTGIFSSTITNDGQLFFLKSGGSEFERCSLNGSASKLIN